MPRRTRKPNTSEAVDNSTEVVEPEVVEGGGVKVMAVKNRMRNPFTGATFRLDQCTDVLDMEHKDNAWTRSQIRAGVLKIVE